jgi:crossover junction endodeoxyribonuclease RusA
MIAFDVHGVPAPQGSKRGIVVGGRAVLVESSAKVKPWRSDVRDAAQAAHQGAPLDGPLRVTIEFRLPRPKSLPKRSTPTHCKRPDLDKLVRATFDALTSAGLFGDDAQVHALTTWKRYCEPTEAPGCAITVRTVTP